MVTVGLARANEAEAYKRTRNFLPILPVCILPGLEGRPQNQTECKKTGATTPAEWDLFAIRIAVGYALPLSAELCCVY